MVLVVISAIERFANRIASDSRLSRVPWHVGHRISLDSPIAP